MSTTVSRPETAAPPPGPHPAPGQPVASDAAGHIETHGVDFIPPGQRHGRPRELAWIWMSTNVVYLNFVLGGTMTLLGLSLAESLVVVVLGNLWWLAVGWLAISGPVAGSPSVVIMRAMFGIRGNRLFGAGLGVLIGLLYVIINLCLATLAGIALLTFLGLDATGPAAWLVLLAVAAATFTVSVYGHATIVTLSPLLTLALALCFGVLAFFVLGAADFDYTVASLSTDAHWAAFLLGFTIIASGPLSWGTGADYARYLPAHSRRRSVLLWTAVGGFVPAVLIAWLGVLAGTRIDMTDPQQNLLQIVPSWFYPIFLFAILLGSTTNNVLTSYSTGLYVQALGVRLPRAATVVVTAVVSIAASAYTLFVAESFLDTLNSALEISVAVLGPSVAIYAADIALRRNRYDGRELAVETPTGVFWYRGGVCWSGVTAITVATLAAVLSSNTSLYQGPVSVWLGGADLSALVGPLLGAGLYTVFCLIGTPRPVRPTFPPLPTPPTETPCA